MSFRANDALVYEAKGAVFVIERTDPGFSREVLLRRGLELVLKELRDKYNDGEPFEPVMKLRTGQRRRGE